MRNLDCFTSILKMQYVIKQRLRIKIIVSTKNCLINTYARKIQEKRAENDIEANNFNIITARLWLLSNRHV